MKIETFALERWMTTWEMKVEYRHRRERHRAADRSTTCSTGCRPTERAATLDRLLDTRLGYSEAPGSLRAARRPRRDLPRRPAPTTSWSRPGRSRRTSCSSTPCSSRATMSSRSTRPTSSSTACRARSAATCRLWRSAPPRRLPLRPRRAGAARHAAHPPDRRQHAAQPDRRDALRRRIAAASTTWRSRSARGSSATRPIAGWICRAASRCRRRSATSASAGSASAPSRSRSGCRGCGSAGWSRPAEIVAAVLGDARLHHPQPRQAERRAGPARLPATATRSSRATARSSPQNLATAERWFAEHAEIVSWIAAARRAAGAAALPARHPLARAGRPPRRRVQRDAGARQRLRLRALPAARHRAGPGDLRRGPGRAAACFADLRAAGVGLRDE